MGSLRPNNNGFEDCLPQSLRLPKDGLGSKAEVQSRFTQATGKRYTRYRIEWNWGVYAFRFQRPVRNEQDLIENLHAVLPQLKAFYAAALVEHPESTNAHLQAGGV
jgi:hypothetical protein